MDRDKSKTKVNLPSTVTRPCLSALSSRKGNQFCSTKAGTTEGRKATAKGIKAKEVAAEGKEETESRKIAAKGQ